MKKTHEINIRVRYGETDKMGVVYHANYAQYLEVARVEWLRALGVSYKWMEENGVMLPVISLQLNYKNPARYDDLLTVVVGLKKDPGVKIEFDYLILDEKGKILVEANTVLAFINTDSGKPVKCPDYILKRLQ